MDAIISFFQYIQSLGVSVMMPIIICILALCFRVKLGDAIRAGLTVGVAFIGLNLVIGIFGNNLGPTVQHIAELYGLELSVIDVGGPESPLSHTPAPPARSLSLFACSRTL